MFQPENQAAIGILMYPGAQRSALHGLTDMFITANRMNAGNDACSATTLSISHWHLSKGSDSVTLDYCSQPSPPDRLTALVIPPSLESEASVCPPATLTTWLQTQHKSGTVMCSVCAGAFMLAHAGLLLHRPATTHWALRDSFATLFPEVLLQTDKLIIEDGDIITAGGVMAWVDLGMRLVDRFQGSATMLRVARFFLVDPGGREQRFYSTFVPQLHHGDETILTVQHWLQQHFHQPITVAEMANRALMSQRTFLRRFQKASGLNPTRYLQFLRVGRAREYLERSSLSFNEVAWRVGYEDVGSFRKVFQKLMGLSPGEYRRRFLTKSDYGR